MTLCGPLKLKLTYRDPVSVAVVDSRQAGLQQDACQMQRPMRVFDEVLKF